MGMTAGYNQGRDWDHIYRNWCFIQNKQEKFCWVDGMNFKQVLIYDRIREDLRIFCANKTINKVYNEQFLDIVEVVNCDVD